MNKELFIGKHIPDLFLSYNNRDIAARNILLKGELAKISDFGMARIVENEDGGKTYNAVGPLKVDFDIKKFGVNFFNSGCLLKVFKKENIL